MGSLLAIDHGEGDDDLVTLIICESHRFRPTGDLPEEDLVEQHL